MKPIRRMIFLRMPLLMAAGAVLFAACGRDAPAPEADPRAAPAQVEQNGEQVRFGAASPQLQQITLDTVRRGELRVGITAPAHVAVGVVPAESGGALVLFDSQDVTQTYSDYVKSGSALARTTQALAREKDLFAHHIVAQKDLLDAETDHAQAQAERSELESRLRAAGIDPRVLAATPAGTVWVVADVPESQLALIHIGARAALTCNAMPGQRFEGRIGAIGDVVDPATRTVKVRIVLPNRGQLLRPGMFASASFDESATDAVSVPRDAVVHVQGRSYVFAQTAPGVFRRTEVRIGAETQSAYLVSAGVSADQIVACQGVMLLKGLSFGY